MSSTNLHDDACSKAMANKNNSTAFEYVTNTMQFEHKRKKVQFGTKSMGGNVMQDKKRDLVDVESVLRGQTKKISKCGK